jgi:hypothetical protein
MNKKYFLITLIFSFSTIGLGICQTTNESATSSTDKQKRMTISFSGGLAVPVGEFVDFTPIPVFDQNENYNLAGAAESGYGVKVSIGYCFGKHFGVTGVYYSSSLGVPEKTVEEIFESSSYASYSGSVDKMGRWNVQGASAGVNYEFLENKFRIGLNAMAGYQWAESPEVELTQIVSETRFGLPNQVDTYKLLLHSDNSSEFSYSIGSYISYAIGKKLQLKLSADYISAEHTFEGENLESQKYRTGNIIDEKTTEQVSFKQPISFVNIMLGVTYSLW